MSVSIKTSCKNEKINKLVAFYAANPLIPCVFKHRQAEGVSNKKGPSPQTQQNVPAWAELTIDGDYQKIVYEGAKDIYGAKPHLFDKDTSLLRKTAVIKPISFQNFRLGIFGDSAERLHLIEYLLHLEEYSETKYVTHIPHEAQHDSATADPLLGLQLAKMVEVFESTEDGAAFLLKRAKDGTLPNVSALSVGAMNETKGIHAVVEILQTAALNSPVKFKEGLINIYKAERDLLKKATADNILGYNSKTKSFQLKEVGTGEWAKDQILLTTAIPNEECRNLLMCDYLQEAKEVAAKIKILTINAKTVA